MSVYRTIGPMVLIKYFESCLKQKYLFNLCTQLSTININIFFSTNHNIIFLVGGGGEGG